MRKNILNYNVYIFMWLTNDGYKLFTNTKWIRCIHTDVSILP